jgi:hypothetical protein
VAGWTETPVGQTFADVAVGSTFYLYVERVASRGIVNGYPCGGPGEPCQPPTNRPYFRPNNPATRGQMSKIAANAFFPGCALRANVCCVIGAVSGVLLRSSTTPNTNRLIPVLPGTIRLQAQGEQTQVGTTVRGTVVDRRPHAGETGGTQTACACVQHAIAPWMEDRSRS